MRLYIKTKFDKFALLVSMSIADNCITASSHVQGILDAGIRLGSI